MGKQNPNFLERYWPISSQGNPLPEILLKVLNVFATNQKCDSDKMNNHIG
jgi:hypothetical protein